MDGDPTQVRFNANVTITGPLRAPAQMLGDQVIRGHASLHDESVANSLGINGAPIEAPTHFSQIDPLAYLLWGNAWFERGCISSHFRTMVAEGEFVRASVTTVGPSAGTVEAAKLDGTPVLTGTVAVGPTIPATELDRRRTAYAAPSELHILDQLEVGLTKHFAESVSITFDDANGPLYPFSLAEKLEKITESHPWYTREGGPSSPWGRAIVPMEMISVLAHKLDPMWPIRTPSVGLFLDLEIRLLHGPVFVGEDYSLESEVVGVSESRRTESYWTLTTLRAPEHDEPVATVLLHAGVFKDSYAGYPASDGSH